MIEYEHRGNYFKGIKARCMSCDKTIAVIDYDGGADHETVSADDKDLVDEMATRHENRYGTDCKIKITLYSQDHG